MLCIHRQLLKWPPSTSPWILRGNQEGDGWEENKESETVTEEKQTPIAQLLTDAARLSIFLYVMSRMRELIT